MHGEVERHANRKHKGGQRRRCSENRPRVVDLVVVVVVGICRARRGGRDQALVGACGARRHGHVDALNVVGSHGGDLDRRRTHGRIRGDVQAPSVRCL